jgi:hypothetical protein
MRGGEDVWSADLFDEDDEDDFDRWRSGKDGI